MLDKFEQQIFDFTNVDGNTIHSVYSYEPGKRPLVIITPQYEKTLKNNLVPMVYLVNNGFNVLRYDNTNHRGNSDGDFKDFTFSSSLKDLHAISESVKNSNFINTENGVALLGISISSRTAFRFFSECYDFFDTFISLLGVIDMQHTLKSITNIDLIGETMSNPEKKWGIQKVIKYPIDYDNFLYNCINENFHNLDSTRNDVQKMKTDTFIIAAEEDSWVNYNDYDYVFSNNKQILKEFYKIPEAGHRLYKTNGATEDAFHHMLQILNRYFKDRNLNHDEIKEFENFELAHLNRLECRREKQYHCVHQNVLA